MQYEVYAIHKSKIYDHDSKNSGQGEWKYIVIVETTCDVVERHSKTDRDKLKMYNINPKGSTEIIKQKVTGNKPQSR